MDFLLTVIIAMAVVLLAVTAYMEWIGLMNIFTPRVASRYLACCHFRLNRISPYEECWRCRHSTAGHPSRLIHH